MLFLRSMRRNLISTSCLESVMVSLRSEYAVTRVNTDGLAIHRLWKRTMPERGPCGHTVSTPESIPQNHDFTQAGKKARKRRHGCASRAGTEMAFAPRGLAPPVTRISKCVECT